MHLFLDNSNKIFDKNLDLFDLFNNLLSKSQQQQQQQISYIENSLQIKLTKYLYYYSTSRSQSRDINEIKVNYFLIFYYFYNIYFFALKVVYSSNRYFI